MATPGVVCFVGQFAIAHLAREPSRVGPYRENVVVVEPASTG
jgi:hypothetical protein